MPLGAADALGIDVQQGVWSPSSIIRFGGGYGLPQLRPAPRSWLRFSQFRAERKARKAQQLEGEQPPAQINIWDRNSAR